MLALTTNPSSIPSSHDFVLPVSLALPCFIRFFISHSVSSLLFQSLIHFHPFRISCIIIIPFHPSPVTHKFRSINTFLYLSNFLNLKHSILWPLTPPFLNTSWAIHWADLFFIKLWYVCFHRTFVGLNGLGQVIVTAHLPRGEFQPKFIIICISSSCQKTYAYFQVKSFGEHQL